MRQFIYGSDAAFEELERRALGVCVVFGDQELPPGCDPPTARIGFELQPESPAACLLVDRGVTYDGPAAGVREWLASGERHFPNFTELKNWIRGELAGCYNEPADDQFQPASGPACQVDPHQLTDLAEVRPGPDQRGPLYLDQRRLLEELQTHVRGQQHSLRTLAHRVARHVARRHPRRPATFLAVGPTGCGKTKTAESLGVALQAVAPEGNDYGYLRLDMTEYQERHRISQLLGAPQGYVGYGDGAQLADALAANPKTIVLFDEIEKAHPDIFLTLINAMDAGRLSTPSRATRGRVIDCRQAMFLFTSNLDAADILLDLEQRAGFGDAQLVNQVCRRRLRAAGLKPELIARIGAFLVFQPLTASFRAEIVTQAIARLAGEYGLRVGRIEPSVVEAVLDSTALDGFGVRPDEYAIDDLLGAVFAQAARGAATHEEYLVEGPPFGCRLMSKPQECETAG